MEGVSDLSVLLVHLKPQLHDSAFGVCSVPHGEVPLPLPWTALFATLRETEGLTLVAEYATLTALDLPLAGPFRCISLQVHSSLHAVGLTAQVSHRLAAAGISCNMLAGYYHDHLLVPADRAEDALMLLEQLARDTNTG